MSRPPDWLAEPDLPLLQLPAPLQGWLRERGSLTRRLHDHWGDVAVLPLQEGVAAPLPHEAQRLGRPADTPVWLRCILLVCRGQPRVYARTAIPDWGPDNAWAEVQGLGRQPLGELLFRLPDLQRSGFEWARGLDWPHATHWPQAMARPVARRCVFVRGQAPLLLTEVFLDPDSAA